MILTSYYTPNSKSAYQPVPFILRCTQLTVHVHCLPGLGAPKLDPVGLSELYAVTAQSLTGYFRMRLALYCHYYLLICLNLLLRTCKFNPNFRMVP